MSILCWVNIPTYLTRHKAARESHFIQNNKVCSNLSGLIRGDVDASHLLSKRKVCSMLSRTKQRRGGSPAPSSRCSKTCSIPG